MLWKGCTQYANKFGKLSSGHSTGKGQFSFQSQRKACHPTTSSSVVPFSSCLQSFPASRSFLMNRLFASGGQSIGASASACLSNEHSGLISFRIDWFDLLAVQGTLKSLLQHHSSKASLLQCSAFFMVQLSPLYMTTGKTIALTITDLCWQSNVSAF